MTRFDEAVEIMAKAHWLANSRPSSRSWDELKPAERAQKRNAIRTSINALRASGFEIIAPTDSHIPATTGVQCPC